MSMLVRTANLRRVVARPALRQVRSLHIENTVDNTIPGGSKNKKAFALRMIVLYGTGFALPFVANSILLARSAGSAAE